MQKKSIKELEGKRIKIILYGSAFAFIISVLVFALIFYLAYLFEETALEIMFNLFLIIIGILVYYILLNEFISYFFKKS